MGLYSERMIDLNSEILRSRVIYLYGEINDATADYVCKQLIFLDNENKSEPIQMFINSPGGSVMSGLAIIDTMQNITAPVYTCVNGCAASMAAVILASGEIGNRYCYNNSTIMIHQASSGAQGNIQDMIPNLKFTEDLNSRLLAMLAENTGKTVRDVRRATERDKWLTSQEALLFGIVDEILCNTSKDKARKDALKKRFKKKS